MKRYLMPFLVALVGVAVSVPAQFRQSRRAVTRGQAVVVEPAPRGHVVRNGSPRPVRHARGVRSAPRHRSVHQQGRWETRVERVLVPGFWQWQSTPATYGWIYSGCGHRHWGVIRPACQQRVWVPPRWEHQSRRVWVGC